MNLGGIREEDYEEAFLFLADIIVFISLVTSFIHHAMDKAITCLSPVPAAAIAIIFADKEDEEEEADSRPKTVHTPQPRALEKEGTIEMGSEDEEEDKVNAATVKKLLETIQCIQCKIIITTPRVMQCVNGHFRCNVCLNLPSSCTICDDEETLLPVRSLLADRLLGLGPRPSEENILDTVTCPICLYPCTPPVMQCREGHFSCNRCSARNATVTGTTDCSTCRTTVGREAKSLLADLVLREVNPEVRCLNWECEVLTSVQDLERHTDQCSHKPKDRHRPFRSEDELDDLYDFHTSSNRGGSNVGRIVKVRFVINDGVSSSSSYFARVTYDDSVDNVGTVGVVRSDRSQAVVDVEDISDPEREEWDEHNLGTAFLFSDELSDEESIDWDQLRREGGVSKR